MERPIDPQVRPRLALEAAKRRYLYDAEFHAKVHTTLQVVLLTHEELSPDEEGLVITAAALALDLPLASLIREAGD